MPVIVRPEKDQDHEVVAELVRIAFLGNAHSDGGEPRIIERLRVRGELSVSLVATREGAVAGHIAFSPVSMDPEARGWYGLGPLAVDPSCQREGVGSLLVREGLNLLRARRASGCVVFGSPAYYGRLGFQVFDRLVYPGGPPQYFLAQAFNGVVPQSVVSYSEAFAVSAR